MILLHISCSSKEQADNLISLLFDKKLMLDAHLSEKTRFKSIAIGKKESFKQILITGITKALLYNAINEEIRNKYPENMPLIYATPIIYMDQEQTKKLKYELKKV